MSEDEKSQAEGSQQEEENPEPPLLVTKDQIVKGLSRIQRTHGKSSAYLSVLTLDQIAQTPFLLSDGSSYAFAALTMEETDPPVEDLGQELQSYEHLQHLYLSKNGIRDISSIAYLHHLLTINVNTNAVGSIKFLEELGGSEDRLQFLQVSHHLNTVTAPSCTEN